MKRNAKSATSPAVTRIRCAVYTRKSTEEGLEQEFNSLDAQRDAGENYIKSLVGEGWTCLPDRYDDGGFTGGNMERPALMRLMADIEAGKVDAVVVYKVDRLSRSLLDFARMMQAFDTHKVSFVSVTQQFNTATSMGRLVLNVLPSGSTTSGAGSASGGSVSAPGSGSIPGNGSGSTPASGSGNGSLPPGSSGPLPPPPGTSGASSGSVSGDGSLSGADATGLVSGTGLQHETGIDHHDDELPE